MRSISNCLCITFTAILLFSSLITIGSASLDGTYVPVSTSFDYSPYGDYLGFYDEDNDPYLIAYYDNGPSGVSSSDSLLSESWAVPVLIDDDSIEIVSWSGTALEDGYSLDVVTNTEHTSTINIRKDGTVIDTEGMYVGDTYIYRKDITLNGNEVEDFPILIFTLDSIYTGESYWAGITGIFQLSETAYEVELDRSVDVSSWSMNITAPDSIQDLTIGIDQSATDKLDTGDKWSLPPYPINKTFLMLDRAYAKNIKPGVDGTTWDLMVIVPEGETTSLSWDSDAVDGVYVHIMAGTSELSSGQIIGEGKHTYTIYATYGESFDPIPSINIDSPSRTILRDFTLSGTIVDDNLESAQYSVNGQEYTLSYSTSSGVVSFNQELNLVDDDYVVEVIAFDSGSTNRSVSFEIDNTAPDTNMSIDVRGDNTLISVSASDSNALSVVQCIVTGTDYIDRDRLVIRNSNSFDELFKFYGLDVGTYSATVYVEDCAGNIAYMSEDFDIIDSYAPEITIDSPEEGVTYGSFPSINVTTDEEATFAYSLNGNNSNTTSGLESYIVEGANTLVVYATDSVGNTASEDVTFYYLIEEEDWNPWNDIDSEDGALIATSELQEAIHYWLIDSPLSNGEVVTTRRLQYLISCWLNNEICEGESVAEAEESSSGSMASITANRTVSSYNVTLNSTFTVTVEMTPDLSIKALLLDEDYPDDWNITNIDDDERSFKNLTNEWIWPSTISGGENCTVVYNVTVPANLTGGMYNISGNVSAYGVNVTEVSGDTEVYLMDDWNPWNDWDSEDGRYISLSEIREATVYWKFSAPIPRTGHIISLSEMRTMIVYWKYSQPM